MRCVSRMHTVTACIPIQVFLFSSLLVCFFVFLYTPVLETEISGHQCLPIRLRVYNRLADLSEIVPNIARNCPAFRHVPCSGIAGFTADYTQ